MYNLVLFRKIRFPIKTILFICLIKSIKSLDFATTDDLLCVCDIRNSSSEVVINSLPSFCTAISTSQNNEDDVKKLAALKLNTPFIMYFKGFSYDEWETYLYYEKQFTLYIREHNLDGIIFDNMYRGTQYDLQRNQAISTFFKKLKQLNPNTLIGLALPKDADILPYAFDYSYLDPVVDFYVIQTINYRRCKYNTIMMRTCTVGDMRKSLEALKQTISDMGKVLLTVQVYSMGITRAAKNGSTLISYSDMCHYNNKKLSKHRKYCKDSLESLYKKGRLVYDYQMLGVYIEYIDYDDFSGSCGCDISGNNTSKFPATATILAGTMANTTSEPEDCSDFGNYDETGDDSDMISAEN